MRKRDKDTDENNEEKKKTIILLEMAYKCHEEFDIRGRG